MKLRLISGVSLLLLYCSSSMVFGQKALIDSLSKQLIFFSKGDSNRVNILNELSRRNYINNPNLASEYAKEALDISRRIHYLKGEAEGNRLLGAPQLTKGNVDSAIFFYKKALELHKIRNDKRGIAASMAAVGSGFAEAGRHKDAMEYFIEALRVYEQLESYAVIGVMYNSIGNLYLEQGVHDIAIENYKRSLQAFEKTEEKSEMALVLNNIAFSLREVGSFVEALEYIKKGFENAEFYQNRDMLGRLSLNAGSVYLSQKKYDLAKSSFEAASKIHEELGNISGLVEVAYYRAEVESYLGNVKESRDYLLYILENLDSQGLFLPRIESDALKLLSQQEQKLGNHSKGLDYALKARAISDSLYQQENAEAIAELQTIYETEKKEQAIRLLEAKNVAARFQVTLAIVIGLVLLVGISFIFWSVNKEKATKRRLELESVKRELENYGTLIAEKDSFMTSLIDRLRDMSRVLKTLKSRKEINMLIDSLHQNVELTWDEEHLIQRITQVNCGFFKELESRLGKLSKNEKRIASLVQMELSNKEIGGILNINAKSVAQARYRLKKRMDLGTEEDLVEFLKSLATK